MNEQVDMLALAAEEKKVTGALLALAAMYREREPDDFYWKAVLTFSYRFFHLGAIEEGVRLLRFVPPAWLRGPMVQQMEEDATFAELAKRIADKLVETHKVAQPHLAVDTRKVNVQNVQGRA